MEGIILNSLFLVGKKDGSNQSDKIGQSGPPWALQDGKPISAERNATVRELYVQNWLKRRIFYVSIVKKIPELCQVWIERLVIKTFMPMLWNFFRAKIFHQIFEISNIFGVETFYKNYNISKPYAFDGSFLKRITSFLEYFDISASILGGFN